jgi:hypothetical protein
VISNCDAAVSICAKKQERYNANVLKAIVVTTFGIGTGTGG